ncbi:MAG: hypothetical protein J7500_05835 [Sphingomonas sp.]|uniref:hypothetical protein n=1 Tax=Sphingomonas sp. TaxID=28214 RepID=UPI001B1E2775|nr:hypothetical protein [Sphingomonas sp.]MBO9622215.1 hypothetical protein [Sphingomonas sp.]
MSKHDSRETFERAPTDAPDPANPQDAGAPAEAPPEDAAGDSEDDFEDDFEDDPEDDPEADAFGPVPVRYRHDGWVPDRQHAFIEALAGSGCVDEACRAVGMGRSSAYALRRRPDAQAFRLAWDAAMDVAVTRLADAALSRAINGVAVPIFHQGEQIGERRQYNERLTMFLLRYRDPTRYGRWLDRIETRQPTEGPVAILSYRVGRMLRAAWAAFNAALDGRSSPAPEAEVVVDAGRIEGTLH